MGLSQSRHIQQQSQNSVSKASSKQSKTSNQSQPSNNSIKQSKVLKNNILYQLEQIDQRLDKLNQEHLYLQKEVNQLKNQNEECSIFNKTIKKDQSMQTIQYNFKPQYELTSKSKDIFLGKRNINEFNIMRTNKNKYNRRLQDARDERKKMLQIKFC